MNILFLTTHANTGGITSYILTLGEGLVSSGHHVWVVSSGGDAVPRMEALGMRHVRLNIRTKSEVHPKLWLSLGALKDLTWKNEINIIHSQTRVTQVLGHALSRLTGIPMVTTCHGFFRPRWFRKAFPCWGKGVIAISKPVVRHLSEDFHVPQDRIHWIVNGVDLKRFAPADDVQRRLVRQEWKIAGNTPLIGIIARLSDVKGIDVLIRAMPRVLKEMPGARLMIVGQGPEEAHLKKLAVDLSLSGEVFFRNTINQTNRILPAFDVFAMPSLMEGLGLSVMEAQACGVPVVASAVGGLVDLIEDGQSGFLVPSRDESVLADRLITLLKNPGQGMAMAERARLNIQEHFSADIMVQKTLQVYEQYSRR
ncbi:MAG: glycosyltransferase family 4 protein [Candidatus Omnitrophica bacterium]|nr:glycosyltransferase family 4 protein [Candidatus Omnitrophota bacterium]MDE2222536.1 glycosyltransferase family 4 protein [Candidatus Omnitrophota bacterium]